MGRKNKPSKPEEAEEAPAKEAPAEEAPAKYQSLTRFSLHDKSYCKGQSIPAAEFTTQELQNLIKNKIVECIVLLPR